jgi:uncharacterized protein YjcR
MTIRPDAFGMPFDPQRFARTLYWCGWSVTQISDLTGTARSTVQSWKDRGDWDKASPLEQADNCTVARYNMLVMKDQKSGADYKEIDLLGRQMAQFARIRRYEAPGGHEGDLNEKVANRNANAAGRKKADKNLLDAEACAKLEDALLQGSYLFQRAWWDAQDERIRMLLKSRQIGATYHFAHERIVRALKTGNNQIFISASRAQANIFRQYIVEFVQKVTGVKLKGDPLVIDRGADAEGNALEPVTLYFLGTNYRTAQGYHGDVIIDECFWIYGFEQLYKVASAMATQARYTVTLFSTPSTVNHEAYALWSGERFNKRRQKADKVNIDISHKALRRGLKGPDRIWRQIVTLQDAIDSGYDLIDIEDLRFEYSVDEFANLFDCQFVDDSASAFPIALVGPAMVDSWEVWRDYSPYSARPYGDGEVWLGYDPNDGGGDDAGLVAVAPPIGPKGKFRCLEKKRLTGLDFEGQSRVIREWTRRYRVTEIAIDCTGAGNAVFQLVLKWFPMARRIDYSPMVKTLMVQKAQNVFRNRRIEFDAGWTDLVMALVSIHPQLTPGQKHITYVAGRTAGNGHADLAWALLHALYCEPLDATDPGASRSTMEIMG